MNQSWLQSLGEQISAARRAARVSQVSLAKYVGIARPHLSAYERGRVKSPKAEVLARITEKLNCKLTINGIVLAPEQLAPRTRADFQTAVQLKLPLGFAKDAVKALRAIQRGATVTIERRGSGLVLRARFGPSITQQSLRDK